MWLESSSIERSLSCANPRAAAGAMIPSLRDQNASVGTGGLALSRAIEHETLAQAAAPVLFGAFQHEEFYRDVEPRYRRISQFSDAAIAFADFKQLRRPAGGPIEVPIAT